MARTCGAAWALTPDAHDPQESPRPPRVPQATTRLARGARGARVRLPRLRGHRAGLRERDHEQQGKGTRHVSGPPSRLRLSGR